MLDAQIRPARRERAPALSSPCILDKLNAATLGRTFEIQTSCFSALGGSVTELSVTDESQDRAVMQG